MNSTNNKGESNIIFQTETYPMTNDLKNLLYMRYKVKIKDIKNGKISIGDFLCEIVNDNPSEKRFYKVKECFEDKLIVTLVPDNIDYIYDIYRELVNTLYYSSKDEYIKYEECNKQDNDSISNFIKLIFNLNKLK